MNASVWPAGIMMLALAVSLRLPWSPLNKIGDVVYPAPRTVDDDPT
jgi:hypothetical protein